LNTRRLLLNGCLVLLAACSLGRPMPETTTYLVAAPGGVTGESLQRAGQLRLGTVRVAAPFAGTALMYRLDDVRYAADPYHAFVSEPGAMLAAQMAVWLRPEGALPANAAGSITGSVRFALEVNVVELYGDFRPGRPPAAVLAIQFSAIDQSGMRPMLRYERLITQRIDLPEASPGSLVRGFGAALTLVLAQLATDLGSTPIEQ
jgi:cholesterol transport system auxiliary component